MSHTKDLLDKKNYMIGVPSRERSSMIRERKGLWLHTEPIGSYPVRVCVRESEMKDYEDMVPAFSVPDSFTIANKRQRLMEYAIHSVYEFLFIIDDDVSLYYRDENLSSKYTSKRETFQAEDCFNRILYEAIMLCGEKAPIIGLPLKLGSFGLKWKFPKNIPVIRFVCYHVPTLVKENIKMDGMGTVFMSDRFTHLSLLSKGYYSLSNCGYAVGDQGTGYKGGCSITRTVELQSASAIALRDTFPNHVELKIKNNGLWDAERLDCRISWRKFLKEGESNFIPTEEGKNIIEREGYVCRSTQLSAS